MATYIIGDLHGYDDVYATLLADAGLTDEAGHWQAGDATLWLIGDLFDRGESGVACVARTMRLQDEAAAAGGHVACLLGNHEMMILAAHRFGNEQTRGGGTFVDQWLRWGGQREDLERLSPDQVRWLGELPAMALVDDALLIHADALLYVDFGTSIDAVNSNFRALIDSDDRARWERTLATFGEHGGFSDLAMTGATRAQQIAKLYGARRIIHGHTPIPLARDVPPASVTEAWEYAGGHCINVDGGIYMGSPGFVYRLA